MKQISEKRIKLKVKEVLEIAFITWWFMPVANEFTRKGIPDFIGCYDGLFFAVETKTIDNELSAAQKHERLNILKAGGAYFVITSETGLKEFKEFLNV